MAQLRGKRVAAFHAVPQLQRLLRIAIRDSLDRIRKLLARDRIVGTLFVSIDKVLRSRQGPEPVFRLVEQRLVQRSCQPARPCELASLDCERIACPVIILRQLVLLAHVREHRVAFLLLAMAGQPEVAAPVLDTITVPGFDLGVQGDAVQPGDPKSLVVRLVDVQVLLELAGVGEMKSIAIAQFARRLEGSVTVEKRFQGIWVCLANVSPEPGCSQVRPQDIFLQQRPLLVT